MDGQWSSIPFTYDGVTREVQRPPPGPPLADGLRRPGIFLMHELSGLTPATQDFATSLAQRNGNHPGFDVYIPVAFGSRGTSGGLVAALAGAVRMACVRAEFRALQSESSSPIAGWMRALSGEIATRTGGNIGVVGMCLTGSMVLSMIWDPAVKAAVAAQPSLPFKTQTASITASSKDIDASRESTVSQGFVTKRVRLLRFADDKSCLETRLEGIAEGWPQQGADSPIEIVPFPGRGHATLTEDHQSTKPDSRTLVRDFFEGQL